MMYQLSKDYNALFDLLLKGEEPVCFVDNKHDESPRVARDVCRVRRAREYNIIAVSRGTIYFSVDPWLKEESALSEREIFCGICDGVNLEWIVPTVRPAMNMVDMARIEEAARALWQEWHEGIDAAAWDDGYVPTMSVQWETAFLAGARWRDRQDAVELEAVKSQLLNVYTEEQATERVRRAVEGSEAYLKAELAALREAVKWERECCQDIRPLVAWAGLYVRHGEDYVDGVAEDLRAIQDAARAEVDRLLGEGEG